MCVQAGGRYEPLSSQDHGHAAPRPPPPNGRLWRQGAASPTPPHLPLAELLKDLVTCENTARPSTADERVSWMSFFTQLEDEVHAVVAVVHAPERGKKDGKFTGSRGRYE